VILDKARELMALKTLFENPLPEAIELTGWIQMCWSEAQREMMDRSGQTAHMTAYSLNQVGLSIPKTL
jgi:hypothetical protein